MALPEGFCPEAMIRGEDELVRFYHFYGDMISQKKYPTRRYFFLNFYFISQI